MSYQNKKTELKINGRELKDVLKIASKTYKK